MKRRGPVRDGPVQMKKLQLSVQEFVEKAEGSGGSAAVTPVSGAGDGGRVKSRRELRKEKRLSKKSRKKAYYRRVYSGPQPELDGPTHTAVNTGKRAAVGGQGHGDGHLAGKRAAAVGGQGPRDSHLAGKRAAVTGQVTRDTPPAGKRAAAVGGQGPRDVSPVKLPGQSSAADGQGTNKKKKISKGEARRKALLEANEKEEKEIKRLEKSLRMNKRKNKSSLPQAFTQDGLDYILGVLEPGGSVSGLYDQEDEEANTAEKLQKLSEKAFEEDGGLDSDLDEEIVVEDSGEDSDLEEQKGVENDGKDSDLEDDLGGEDDGEDSDREEELGGESEDGDDYLSEKDKPMEHESEYSGQESEYGSDGSDSENVADSSVINKHAADLGTKYIPPQLRQSSDAVDVKKKEELERLKKSVKGLMNRLTEPNMASISGQLEELYMANSRNDMNETVASIVLSACITPAKMPDRLMMEHVLLISVLHNTVGIEVGAHILELVVKQFHDLHGNGSETKECDNLIIFIGHLYNFHIIDSGLVFDILRMLVLAFTERDIELILLLLKNVGFSLRKDDAVALKELICEAQTKANAADKTFQDQTRVRFMLETMLALKNNDMRKIPGYDPEPVEKLRKLQRSLVHSSVSGSDTRLRVSLENIMEADKVGRWWIVGSSWSGAPMIGQSSVTKPSQTIGKLSAKIMDLARKQRMNTDIRRNIFCVLMTSEDYLDAFEKLLKLGLKHHQEREIVHVLIDCCLQEKCYNPFYAFLSCKFCEYDRRFQMTFQFSMWDKFKDLGSLSTTTFSNLIHLLSHLIKNKSLPLSIFKVIEFSELDKIKVSFLRQVLSKLLMEAEVDDLALIFGKVSDNAKLGMLREGLKLFISHFLLKNIRAQKSAEEADLLTHKADLAVKALEAKDNRLRL
ncbi:nucleolar MIF4G domain-containing protein 1 [Pseudophryne corroboree]|uniref:nucleolar MIF4G domain-containing protein 1 n=1 Tax=Pseudophryne corroboree TaxID=495146 RepID=UPI0030820B34